MTLHLGFSHASQRDAEQQQEVKDARRLLKERIRDDWDYPALPAFQEPVPKVWETDEQALEERIAGFRIRNSDNSDKSSLLHSRLSFDPVEWRERQLSTEESSEDESVATLTSNGSRSSTYKFEGPDSVGAQISDRRLANKRKRQEALVEEVTWNDGLAHWLARRDAWTAAHTSQQIQIMDATKEALSASTSASANSTPRTSTSSANSHNSGFVSSPSTTPELEPHYTTIDNRPQAPPAELLVPLAPPILADHPVRRKITPAIYPEIYAKIILQGRTPSVPINLLVLTHALVQGWKDDGEWPPKQGPVEKSIGRKRSSGHESTLKHSVKAVGRVLRITGGESIMNGSKDKG